MNQSPIILLTGFTGIIGKRTAYQLAELGYDVICPIRAGSEAEARGRFQKIFSGMKDLLPKFNEALEKKFIPVPGDVREKGLGIPESSIQSLKGPIRSIWHLAARLDLTETKSQDVYQTNFVGTLNVLEFAKKHNIPELHYVSTFGASGEIRQGIVREIPGIKPPSFRNTYERTKWEAERQVWQAQVRGEIMASIYRPSIVVGDSVHGRYEQFNVFNHVFDVVSRVRNKLCEKEGLDPKKDVLRQNMRVFGDPNATLNIVPIDFVIDTMMKIFTVPRSLGRVYHIVNPKPPSLGLAGMIFLEKEPWDGAHLEMFDVNAGFANPYEKFIAKQLAFLAPYIMGEAVYDYTNVQTVLAFHGGMPSIDNSVFLKAIAERGKTHGWQEQKSEDFNPDKERQVEKVEFQWPDQNTNSVDFTPHHPVEAAVTPSANYPITDRLLSKVYQVREKIVSRIPGGSSDSAEGGRDIVIVPFGLGMTRRGEAELEFYQHNSELTNQVFARMNQVMGFDLRAFARQSINGHEAFDDIHDNGCWSVGDDLVHLIKIFRDLHAQGCTDLHQRLQILPFSAGTYLSAWLSGILSFEDMALLTHQAMHLMAVNEYVASRKEIEHWYFNPRAKLSDSEVALLKDIRTKFDPESALSIDALEKHIHGRLEMVFAHNPEGLKNLIAEVRENRIGVDVAIKLTPNTVVFAGNELEILRFRKLFGGKRKIELRRIPIDVHGTPHFPRLRDASKYTVELLKIYDEQGRLRDPVIPFMSYNGDVVTTREQFIKSVAGIPDQTCCFDQMIERVLKNGGRHFVLVQSGLASTAGDVFDAIIRNNANTRKYKSVEIYHPNLRSSDPHPICKLFNRDDEKRSDAVSHESLAETIRWYERQLAELKGDQAREMALNG